LKRRCEYGTAGVQIESESEIKRTPAAWNAGISMCGVFFILYRAAGGQHSVALA